MNLLRHPAFLRLATGQLVSTLADWALRTMLLIWVFTLTHSGVAVSVVGLAEALPLLLVAPVAGVFADRWSRAATMAGAALARALLVLPLLAVSSRAGLALIILVTLLANAAAQFFLAAAGAAVPAVVGRERAGQANSLLSVVLGVVMAVGPGLGALLFALAGPHRTIALLGLLYAGAIGLLLRVPAPRPDRGGEAGPSFRREVADGLRCVRRSVVLRSVMLVMSVGYLGGGAANVLGVVFVTRALHQHAAAVGVIMVAGGIGTVGGGAAISLASARLAGRYHLVLGLAVLSQGLILVVYSLAPTLPIAVFARVLTGLLWSPILAAVCTLLQLAGEDAVLGRIMSLYNMCTAAAMILSMACGGALADLLGVRPVLVASALFIAVAGAVCLALLRAAPEPRAAPSMLDGAAPVAALAS